VNTLRGTIENVEQMNVLLFGATGMVKPVLETPDINSAGRRTG